ncbi:MAG TPA: hypothetical protein VIN02_01620 [Sulfurovum sp.]
MRQNHTGVFHKAIIASICCIILIGCGYKTDPVYVEESVENNTSMMSEG